MEAVDEQLEVLAFSSRGECVVEMRELPSHSPRKVPLGHMESRRVEVMKDEIDGDAQCRKEIPDDGHEWSDDFIGRR